MSERDIYPPGVPCWVDTLQDDPEAAAGFYAGVFGWEFPPPGSMPGDPPGRYYVARVRGRDVAGVGSRPPDAPPGAAWSTYVSVASADEAAAAASAAGGSVLAGPFDAPPAGRTAVLADPAGAVFGVWEPGDRQGAQLVNEPGAWSMSLLSTPDPDGAGAFYGSLFGWTTESFGDFTMFRLPGYVGGEPEQPVSREVIAVMGRADDGAAGWMPDFWVESCDDAAASAARLGGAVIMAPVDDPISRSAVLADPTGATFSATTKPQPQPPSG
jgi:uncharacterized protein